MRYASVCDGIGAVHVAWQPLGWKCVWTSEIDMFPATVVETRWGFRNLGDMTRITQGMLDECGPVDLICGGTPCQSFSVAGLRKGLDDPRGNLALRFLQLVGATRPRWVLWENVPGVLSSSDGRDFGTFIGALAELGYGWAYRVLDAQYVRVDGYSRAVPQRRRRVFVVGHLGDWRRSAAVLFERESLCGDSAPRREAGKGVAGTVAGGARGRGGYSLDDIPLTAAPQVANCLTNRMHKGINTTCDEGQTMIAHALRAEGFDASEDGTGRGTPIVPVAYRTAGDGCVYDEGDASAPLTTNTDKAAHIIAFAQNQRDEVREMEVAGSLAAEPGMKQQTYIATRWAVRRLTPLECERLQGFPDGYTAITYRGKPAADGPRYRAIGNSMAVNVMRWIGRRIQMVDELVNRSGDK